MLATVTCSPGNIGAQQTISYLNAMADTKGSVEMLSAGSHLPHLFHLLKIQSEGCRANSGLVVWNVNTVQYSAVRARASLPLQVLLNEIFSHLRLSCDVVEAEVDCSWR